MSNAPVPPASRPSPLAAHHEDHPTNISRNMQVGMGLFVVYVLLLAGFIYMHTAQPAAMASTTLSLPGNREMVLFGTNLGVVYGMGLIFAAFVIALLYMNMTRAPRPK